MTRIATWVDGAQVIRDMTADELAEHNRPQEPDRAAMQLTIRQLLIGLGAAGLIAKAEGLAWALGTPPALVSQVIATLPPEEQYAATISAVKATAVSRLDPLVLALGQARGLDDATLDAFFTQYSRI